MTPWLARRCWLTHRQWFRLVEIGAGDALTLRRRCGGVEGMQQRSGKTSACQPIRQHRQAMQVGLLPANCLAGTIRIQEIGS